VSNTTQALFVGFGSPHGDDQIGWLIADRLARDGTLPTSVVVKKAAIPLDLLDWLENLDCLHVCDAFQGAAIPGELRRWEWDVVSDVPTMTELFPNFMRLRCQGSHDFGLAAVLDLALRLHRLPHRIVVWAIAGDGFDVGNSVSEKLKRALPTVTNSIQNELNHA